MISFIVQTPKELLQDRVISCLSIVDLVRFDSAVLNHVWRPLALQHLCGAVVSTQSMKISEGLARWIIIRNMRVSHLRVCTSVVDLTSLKQLSASVESLVSFDYCHSVTVEAIKDFMQACTKAKALSFRFYWFDGLDENVFDAVVFHCAELRSIDLSGNIFIDNNHLRILTVGCKLLTDINLSHCKNWFNDASLATTAVNCPQLQKLSLDNCSFCGDKTPQVLAQHCHDLRYLSLRGLAFLTDEGVSALTACAELSTFIVSMNTRITTTGIVTLAQGCTKLEEIAIPRCDGQVDLAIAALVQYCPALKVVRCDSPHITDRALHSLQKCALLTDLELVSATISVTAVMQLLNHCVRMQNLDMFSCSLHFTPPPPPTTTTTTEKSQVTVIPIFPAGRCNSLRKISCSMCASLSDEAFIPLISQCGNVKELNLGNCSCVTDASIMAVATHCKKLQYLDITRTSISSDATVCAIAKGCPELRNLNLSFCSDVTDAGVVEVLQNCPQLRELDIRGCSAVSSALLVAAERYGARLCKICFCQYTNTQSAEMKRFKMARPRCVCIIG